MIAGVKETQCLLYDLEVPCISETEVDVSESTHLHNRLIEAVEFSTVNISLTTQEEWADAHVAIASTFISSFIKEFCCYLDIALATREPLIKKEKDWFYQQYID